MPQVTPQPMAPLPAPPSSSDPVNFDARADAFLGAMPSMVAGMNALADATHKNAAHAEEQAAAADLSRQQAQAGAAEAAQHAAVAGAASNARSWNPNRAWNVNDVVWGVDARGALYRCTQAHSGSVTPPEQDRVRWAPVGARTVLDPLAGPASVTVQRDGQGRIANITSTYDGRPATTTLQRGADGLVSQVVTQYDGRTRTSTIVRSGGRIQSINTEVV